MNEQLKTEQAHETELKYAIYKNAIVHISEINSGLNSGEYKCPKCHKFLIAKKGDIRIHHFAHYHDTSCQGAQKTALHQLAKEILLHEKRVSIPMLENTEQYRMVECEYIDKEVKLYTLVVDVLASYESNTLAIEIKVTHQVDVNKIEVVKENAIEMIEIDLSSYINANLSREELTNIVIKTAPRYWINIPTLKITEEENKMNNSIKVIGFTVASGFRKQDGAPFDMNKIYYVRLLEKTNSPNYKVTLCGGYTASDFNNKIMQLDFDNNPELCKKLESLSFPCDMELTFGTKLQNGQVKSNIVIDIHVI